MLWCQFLLGLWNSLQYHTCTIIKQICFVNKNGFVYSTLGYKHRLMFVRILCGLKRLHWITIAVSMSTLLWATHAVSDHRGETGCSKSGGHASYSTCANEPTSLLV